MKFSLITFALSLLLLGSCNENDSSKNNDTTAADSTTATAAPAIHQVDVQPQEKPESGQYCYINKVYTTGSDTYIDADYIQFLMGKEAVAAARKRGDAERIVKGGDTTYALPNDYYILNENKKLRTLKLAKNFQLTIVNASGENATSQKPVDYLKAHMENDIFILTLDPSETVTGIKQQYVP